MRERLFSRAFAEFVQQGLPERVHDSQVAIPLATLSAQRVTHCYDLMDAAYCSPIICAHRDGLGHVPLIDHNPRGGSKL